MLHYMILGTSTAGQLRGDCSQRQKRCTRDRQIGARVGRAGRRVILLLIMYIRFKGVGDSRDTIIINGATGINKCMSDERQQVLVQLRLRGRWSCWTKEDEEEWERAELLNVASK